MTDTIAAIATAPGTGGISIVRISGPEAERILLSMFRPAGKKPLASHMLTYGHCLKDGEPLDECMAVLMRAPRTYTREDVAELQLHGGSFTAQAVLALCLKHGARLAAPGEFTRRAFQNGRIDLSQAEAVMELIAAQGEQAHRAAMRQLSGYAGSFIRKAADTLYKLQAGVAACIDYPEEISEEEACADLLPGILQLAKELDAVCNERAVHLLHDGLTVALCGRPNVGKSSLLNALLNEDRAIVTAIPGTTRDIVRGDLTLEGSIVHLIDTAGLRETEDPVEQIGVSRARKALEESDCVLLLLDAHEPLTTEDRELLLHPPEVPLLVILNKSDLPPVVTEAEVRQLLPTVELFTLSAALPETLLPLKQALARMARADDLLVLTQPRHLEAARRAAEHLRCAARSLQLTVDLASVDLAAAQNALAEITGDNVEEKLLDQVFSRFCVGK